MEVNEAWLAGFIEGDGWFGVNSQQRGRYIYPKIGISQKNLEPLEIIKETFGINYSVKRRPAPTNYIGTGETYGTKAQEIFDAISPYLSDKRLSQAEEKGFVYNGLKLAHNLDWFAGYYEAEGSIYSRTNGVSTTRYPMLGITQWYSTDTSQFCLNIIGKGYIHGPYEREGVRQVYMYRLSGSDAIKTLESIKHMLSAKRVEQLERVKSAVYRTSFA